MCVCLYLYATFYGIIIGLKVGCFFRFFYLYFSVCQKIISQCKREFGVKLTIFKIHLYIVLQLLIKQLSFFSKL